MRLYTRQAGESLETQNHCTEIKRRAERRAGVLLGEIERTKQTDNLKIGPKSHDATSGTTLADLGLTKHQSSRWPQIASLPEQDFEAYVRRI